MTSPTSPAPDPADALTVLADALSCLEDRIDEQCTFRPWEDHADAGVTGPVAAMRGYTDLVEALRGLIDAERLQVTIDEPVPAAAPDDGSADELVDGAEVVELAS